MRIEGGMTSVFLDTISLQRTVVLLSQVELTVYVDGVLVRAHAIDHRVIWPHAIM